MKTTTTIYSSHTHKYFWATAHTQIFFSQIWAAHKQARLPVGGDDDILITLLLLLLQNPRRPVDKRRFCFLLLLLLAV
jgi:hypothetical protein